MRPSGFGPAGIVLALLRFYKHGVSPWLPKACRFTPTCSEYAMEAIVKYGLGRGVMLAAWRLLRCQPFCKSGYDPVPDIDRWKKASENYEAKDEQ